MRVIEGLAGSRLGEKVLPFIGDIDVVPARQADRAIDTIGAIDAGARCAQLRDRLPISPIHGIPGIGRPTAGGQRIAVINSSRAVGCPGDVDGD